MSNLENFKKIISHSKEYGYVFQSSEIYDGLSAAYDYGPYGVELKNNIKDYWWKAMVQLNEEIVGLDSAIFMHPKVWEASGHTTQFNDPLIDNKDSKKRYRADVLIEDHIAKIEEKIEKDVKKAAKKFGDSFDREKFVSTNNRIIDRNKRIKEITDRFVKVGDANDLNEIKQIILDNKINCPVSGSNNWTDVRQFNLMFETHIGSVSDDASSIYLRPETAQGIFINYLNVQKTARMRLPFGIAQIGKAFRNEIVARQFIFRMREFEQMEMQYFVKPGTEKEWYEHWKQKRLNWHKSLGLKSENLKYHKHEKLAHYAKAGYDIEYNFPIGFKEVEGIHSRTDFDLSQHQKVSGKKIQYFDNEENKSYVPYVVETSIGLDRTFLMILSDAYEEEEIKKENGKTDSRVVLRITPELAPVKLAVLPLVKKDGLPEKAREIINGLKFDFETQYDEKDSIGKRYRRQDAIGTPFCVTIDHQTKEDNTVTIRYRDDMKQERVNISDLASIMDEKVNIKNLLNKI